MAVMFSPALASADSVLQQYSVFTSGDLTANSHVNYNTWVGGNLTGSANSVFAMNAFTGTYGLTVAGTVSGTNIQVNNGKSVAITSAPPAGTFLLNGGGGQVVPTAGLAAQTTAMTTELVNNSAAFAALATNQAALSAGGVFTVNAATAVNGVAVFSIDGSVLSNSQYQNGFQIAGDYASVGSIIINVTGGTSVSSNYNFIGAWSNVDRSKVLWNFENATSLTLNNNFYGTILAMKADVTQGSVSIDSNVFAKSLNFNGEIHGPLYTGFVPTSGAVPEPSSMVMSATALAAALGFARRRVRSRV
ncbi:choice-of-anchor A family protein [Paludisphaera rhizosphaerae]|uniref:choice-of-anchor A family protein n=1 Tax=Paludisphaera rhizosphaerae TaxID=2711216 RepID=UPI0013EB0191|nr:choice-of-anchor A family protein [Paludisphaera rhizosphaerae]